MIESKALEMVICPKCGRPFPKGRRDLGYHHCVNCSPQSIVRPIIEGQGEGEDVTTTIHIVSQQEYSAIQRSRGLLHGGLEVIPEMEEAPDYTTFEQQDEIYQDMSPAEREAKLKALENEQNGMSERSLEEFEQLSPLMDDEEEEDV